MLNKVIPATQTMLGININNLSMDDAIQAIMDTKNTKHTKHVCFVNAHCINASKINEKYHRCLKNSDLCFADGIGMKTAGWLQSKPIRENVNGTDMFPKLLDKVARDGKSVFFLGGKPGVIENMNCRIHKQHPNMRVAGWHHGYFSEKEEQNIITKINNSRPDILFVGFGVPKQDMWIADHINKINAPIAIGVGGLFDFYSGRIPRAPLWMRKMNLEWVYRFYQEPQRMWRRYLIGNVRFLIHAFHEAIKNYFGKLFKKEGTYARHHFHNK